MEVRTRHLAIRRRERCGMSVAQVEQLLRALARLLPVERLFTERQAEMLRERMRASGVYNISEMRPARNM